MAGLLLATLLATATASVAAPSRMLAVADVHGEFDGLVRVLQEGGVLDDELGWAAGGATLVQLGDVLDRGEDVVEVMDLLIRLQPEAASSGGELVALLGNHEVMNLLGILRDVNPEVLADFTDARSERRRERAARQFVRRWQRLARLLDTPLPINEEELRRRWLEQTPPGALEYLEAIGPDGRYGGWLRSLQAVALRDENLFVHGGISPGLPADHVAAINRRVTEEIAAYDRGRRLLAEERLLLPTASAADVLQVAGLLRAALSAAEGSRALQLRRLVAELEDVVPLEDNFLMSADGPFWYRGAAEGDSEELAGVLAAIERLGADRLVVGHTPQETGRVTARADGRVLLIDTGLLASHYPGGRPALLEIRAGQVFAIYPDGRFLLQPGGAWCPAAASESPQPSPSAAEQLWLDPDGRPLPFVSFAEAVEFLRTAEVISAEELSSGITQPEKLLLEEGEVRAHAILKHFEKVGGVDRREHRGMSYLKDSYLFELTAYELDRLLELDRVPPTTLRRVGRHPGVVQLWIEDAMTETERLQRHLEPPVRRSWLQQRGLLQVFDAIIGNTDRNSGNMLWDPGWRLWFIDHTRAFTTARRPRNLEQIVRCERGLWKRLLSLDRRALRELMEPYLSAAESNGLESRIAALIAHVQARIDEFGEAAVLYELESPASSAAASPSVDPE